MQNKTVYVKDNAFADVHDNKKSIEQKFPFALKYGCGRLRA
jgi:hypothetical protein